MLQQSLLTNFYNILNITPIQQMDMYECPLLHHNIKLNSNRQLLHTYRKCSSSGTLVAQPLPWDPTHFAQPAHITVMTHHHATPQAFSGTTRMSRCQKRTSRLYGARED